MSIEAVIGRIGQLQAMIGPRQAGATQTPADEHAASPPRCRTRPRSAAIAGTTPPPTPPRRRAATVAPASPSFPPARPYGAEITAAAQRNGIDPALLAGLVKQESGLQPERRLAAPARAA